MQEIHPEYTFAKKVLETLGLYDPSKTGSLSSKNVFLRTFWKFWGLYPNIRMIHFYYERANSFMAPKVYEFTQMIKGVTLKKSDVILDVGCGEGSMALALGKSVKKVIGLDINAEIIAMAKGKALELPNIDAEFYDKKLEDLDFKNQSFDKIFSFSVIEHIPNYLEVFERIYQLLKPDGELILSIDSFSQMDPKQRDIHQKTFEVQKYFEKAELHALLEKLGFRDIHIEPIFKSAFAEKWFIRVMNNPNEYFGLFKRFYSFLLYYKIVYHEKRVKQQDHGIFLIAKCKK